MGRLTALAALVLASAVIAAPRVLTQPRPMIVVVDGAGQVRAAFQPRNEPLVNPEDGTPPVAVSVTGQEARTPDGMIVSGIAFTGWTEGSGFRVVALALLQQDGAPGVAANRRALNLPRRQFASFTVALRQSRRVEEMKAFGLEPLVVRAELGEFPGAPAAARATLSDRPAVASQKRSRDIGSLCE